MPPQFDPYHRWLGIPPSDQPPNHYRLLGLQLRENDAEVIRDAAERQLGHLRRYLAGESRDVAQQLIDKVSRAQDELLNPAAKRSYDSQLLRENPAEVVFQIRAGSEQSAGMNSELMARLAGHGFDSLHHWLGIPPRDQPPTLYQLLGLQPFESDLDVIREAAERQIAHIRKYSLGQRRAIAEALLRALAEARGQLLDASRRQVYDQWLRQLGSHVSRYAAGAIETPNKISQEVEPPVPPDVVSATEATPAPFDSEDFAAIPLPPVHTPPTPTRRRRTTRPPAWLPYAVSGCVVVVLLLILFITSLRFINRGGSAPVVVRPAIPRVDSPPQRPADTPPHPEVSASEEPTIDSSSSPPPVSPQIAKAIELDPPRNGNPLLDYDRLKARLDEVGIDIVLETYRNSNDADVQLVGRALELSSDVLRVDSSQLWSQLQARTVMSGGVPLSNFDKLRPTQPYWECLTASFAQAGGPLLQMFKGRPRPPLKFTPDGRRIVTCSNGGRQIDVWDLETGMSLTTIAGDGKSVEDFDFTPDGRNLVSALRDSLKVWDLETGSELRTLDFPRANLQSVFVSRDNKVVVSGSPNRSGGPMDSIRVSDVDTGVELTSFGPDRRFEAVVVTRDGRRAISVSNRELKVWDVMDGRELYTLEGVANHRELTVSPDSRLVVARVRSGLKVWDLQNGREVNTLTKQTLACSAIAFNADGSQLVTSSFAEAVKVWEVKSGQELMAFTGHVAANNVAISPDAQTVVSAAPDKTLLMSSVKTGIGPVTLARTGEFTSGIVFAPDNRSFATINGSTIHLWDTTGGQQQSLLAGWQNHSPVAISFDGSTIAYATDAPRANGGGDATIQIWDTRSSRVTITLTGLKQNVVGLEFSHDGRTLRSTPQSGADKYWDVATGEESSNAAVATFPGRVPRDRDLEVIAREDATLTVQDRGTSEPRIYLTIRGDHSFAAATLFDDQQTIMAVDRGGAIHQFRVFGLAK